MCRNIELEHHRSPCRCTCLLAPGDCGPNQVMAKAGDPLLSSWDPLQYLCRCSPPPPAAVTVIGQPTQPSIPVPWTQGRHNGITIIFDSNLHKYSRTLMKGFILAMLSYWFKSFACSGFEDLAPCQLYVLKSSYYEVL